MTDVAERSRRARAALEAADAAIVAALDARARALRQLAELRALDPEGWSGPPRDADVIAAAESAAREMPRELVRGVFREVLGASRRLIAPLRVLYVGPEGGLGHAAAIRHFGRAAELVAVESVTALLDGVRRADEVQGLLPIETSTEGTVAATLEGLLAADLSIVGEITLAASWDLVSATGNASDVDKVYGTASAIAACERQVRAAFPRVTLLDVPTGALAAAMARDDHGAAALVPSVLSGEVDLRTVRASVEDVAGASIRYVVVGR
ncbi:MAG: chorismate mutase, partial [Myxococcota bacterium]|nr:chorismate mutase [Myxococcota bacterium]